MALQASPLHQVALNVWGWDEMGGWMRGVFSVACVGCSFFLEMMIDINRPAKRSSTWYSAVLLAAKAPKYESWVDNDSFLLPDIRYPIESPTMAMGFWASEAQRKVIYSQHEQEPKP